MGVSVGSCFAMPKILQSSGELVLQVAAGGSTDGLVDGRVELQAGTELTRQAKLQEAVPHLMAAQKANADPYATSINLGICFVGLGRYAEAIEVLDRLHERGYGTAVLLNLLAQAYLGDGQRGLALKAFRDAAALTPKDEKLYAYMADACTDHRDFTLGLQVAESGLQQLPDSARLHYERALFLAQLDRLEEARPEFHRAAELGVGSYIGTLALVQKYLYDDELENATRLLRDAVRAGHRDYQTLSLLGAVLLHIGIKPGDPEFAEAQEALEESSKLHANDASTQIALGKMYLMLGNDADAVQHFEIGRRLKADDPGLYIGLAKAYRNLGELEKEHQMEEQLANILAVRQAAKNSGVSPKP